MKKVVFGLLILMSLNSNAQEKEFTFSADKGMTDYIVTQVEGKTASEIYKKTIEWIKVTYKNPDKVILSTIENEYVRFEGASSTIYCVNSMGSKTCFDTKYQIEISIKDGKYKFDLIGVQSFIDKWIDNPVFNNNPSKENINGLYKKDGSLKSPYKYFPEFSVYLNNLNISLAENIVSTVKKSDGW